MVPLMVLPNVTLFPGAMMPLYIFEPKYQKLLKAVLEGDRVFALSMKRVGCERMLPSGIAGLGMVRVAVRRKDNTSHIILQGVARVSIMNSLQTKPFRKVMIQPIVTPSSGSSSLLTLSNQLRKLVARRMQNSVALPPEVLQAVDGMDSGPPFEELAAQSLRQFMGYLDKLSDPGHIADLVTCTFITKPVYRQIVLETFDIKERLEQVIRFMRAENTGE